MDKLSAFQIIRLHLRYHWYLARHKAFVFYAGVKFTGASPWRLMVHDLSKYSPSEWFPYLRYYYVQKNKPNRATRRAYRRAFLHHVRRNLHHWQYWVMISDRGEQRIEPIPEPYIREMIADWLGAGRAINGGWDLLTWWERNKNVVLLEDATRRRVQELIDEISSKLLKE